ncbi:MAG: MFS transporter [Pseudomonadota bacterium]
MSAPLYARHARLLLAAAASYSMSTLFSAMKPVLLTRFVEQNGWSNELSGLAVAMPFVGIALSALVASAFATRFALRPLALCLGGVLMACEALTAVVHESPLLVLALQLCGGLAVGILMGASSRVIATRDKPGPLFGFADMTAVLLMSVMVALVGAAVERGGLVGGYVVAAGIAAVFTVCMLPYRDRTHEIAAGTGDNRLNISVRAVAVVFMALLFVTCSGLGFTYMFTIAQELGISYAEAGRGIGLLLFLSAFACLAGGWASARFGPYVPLAIAYVACAVGWYWVVHAPSPTVFYIALVPAVFALQFNFPVLLDLSGSLDDEGRWGAIAAPLQTSGFAWAAIAAGLIAGNFGIDALAVATGIGMAICLLLLIPASRYKAVAPLPESAT